MAGPPPAKPVERSAPSGGTSIVSNVGGKRVFTTIKSVVATIKRPTFVLEHMENRGLLTKLLNHMVDYIDHVNAPAASSPLLSSTILKDIVFTAGQTQYLKHNLGRPWLGFICIDAFVSNWSGRHVVLTSQNLSASQYIAIRSENAGQYSFLIF